MINRYYTSRVEFVKSKDKLMEGNYFRDKCRIGLLKTFITHENYLQYVHTYRKKK